MPQSENYHVQVHEELSPISDRTHINRDLFRRPHLELHHDVSHNGRPRRNHHLDFGLGPLRTGRPRDDLGVKLWLRRVSIVVPPDEGQVPGSVTNPPHHLLVIYRLLVHHVFFNQLRPQSPHRLFLHRPQSIGVTIRVPIVAVLIVLVRLVSPPIVAAPISAPHDSVFQDLGLPSLEQLRVERVKPVGRLVLGCPVVSHTRDVIAAVLGDKEVVALRERVGDHTDLCQRLHGDTVLGGLSRLAEVGAGALLSEIRVGAVQARLVVEEADPVDDDSAERIASESGDLSGVDVLGGYEAVCDGCLL